MPLIKTKARSLFFSISFIGVALISVAKAEEYKSKTPHYYTPSTTLTGITGLNVVPTSRMDKKGTIRLGIATTDPYKFA